MRQIVDSFTGKTLVLNGEDIDTQTLLEKASVSNYRHLFEGVELLAIDEAQHIPQIGSKLKLIVDELPGIRVIATASSSFNLQSEAGEPLVGRSSQFLLTPFSQQELSAGETPIETYRKLEERLIYGSYPDVTFLIHTHKNASTCRSRATITLRYPCPLYIVTKEAKSITSFAFFLHFYFSTIYCFFVCYNRGRASGSWKQSSFRLPPTVLYGQPP